MQFFWKYVDDLMGKGIETIYILELMFYVSASLIPLALPLAILLSSIMTMGNLSENNELTALKSSGLSLYKILKPLTMVVLIIALCTFYFANYVIPVANYKWHSLIFDIQNTKIASIITPGVYSKELEGYAIKVKYENPKGTYHDIIIHDQTNPNEIKTIRAAEGTLYKSKNRKYIFFKLSNGNVVEELEVKHPTFGINGELHGSENTRPARRSTFDKATYKIDLSGFALNKQDAELFKVDYEMLTVFQLQYALDSLHRRTHGIEQNFLTSLKNSHEYFQSVNIDKLPDSLQAKSDSPLKKLPVVLNKLNNQDRFAATTNAIVVINNRLTNLQGQNEFMNGMYRTSDNYWIEFHRKFALTYAIIVLFFVGAPLGAIVRRGGFGAPVVIAALLFMIYFVLNAIGENLVKSEVLTPFVGMWFASLLLTPLAIVLLRSAANDSPIFDKERWTKLFNRFKRNARIVHNK